MVEGVVPAFGFPPESPRLAAARCVSYLAEGQHNLEEEGKEVLSKLYVNLAQPADA